MCLYLAKRSFDRFSSAYLYLVGMCIVTMLISSVIYGCLNCDTIECGGGFRLHVMMSDNGELPEGDYVVSVGVEDEIFDISCNIAESLPNSKCVYVEEQEARMVAIDQNGWMILLYLSGTQKPDGFDLHIENRSDSKDRFSAVRGPEFVTITVSMNNAVLGEGEFFPKYNHDEDYYGDERCGYCDIMQNENESILLLERAAVENNTDADSVCEESETVLSSIDDNSAILGFSGNELLTASGEEFSVNATWTSETEALVQSPLSGNTVATIAVSYENGIVKEINSSVRDDLSDLDVSDICQSRMEIEVAVSFKTEDGAFNEIWPAKLTGVSLEKSTPQKLTASFDPLNLKGNFKIESISGDKQSDVVDGIFETRLGEKVTGHIKIDVQNTNETSVIS